MKQFSMILGFEFRNYIKNKIFVGITVFLVALIAVVMFSPRLVGLFDRGEDGIDKDSEKPIMLVKSEESDESAYIKDAFAGAFEDYDVVLATDSIDSLKEQITSGDAECAFVLKGLTSYTYYVNNLGMYDMNMNIANEVLENIYRMNAMTESGISEDKAGEILAMQIKGDYQSLGKDQMQNFFYTYIMIFALYMVILLYGQMVATNVASEKSSRAMELLITSAKPASMMFGKVIASCLTGLIQLIAVFGSAFLFFNLNKEYWDGNMIINSIFNMPLDLLIYMLLFFVLGFFIYAFMYGAIGSTVSKLEDINTAVMPVTILFIVAFFVVIFSMSTGDVDNLLMIICSFVPFTSPMAMFTRIAMSTVPPWQIILSVIILIGSAIGIGVLSAMIYRIGVLLYGKTLKISDLFRSVKKK